MEDRLEAAISDAVDEYSLHTIDTDCPVDGDELVGRFILLERGRESTWVSAFDSLEEAGSYALNQEYAEDWAAEVAIDRETLEVYVARSIVWEKKASS